MSISKYLCFPCLLRIIILLLQRMAIRYAFCLPKSVAVAISGPISQCVMRSDRITWIIHYYRCFKKAVYVTVPFGKWQFWKDKDVAGIITCRIVDVDD